jgi:orotidine-5'-phosphate decarboxylase
MKSKEKLIVAIDTSDDRVVRELVDYLEDTVDIYKVGLEQYIASRGRVLDYLKQKNKKIFLDLKIHDIPNTMEAAIRGVVNEGVWMATMHVSDFEGMKRVAEAAGDEAEKRGVLKPIIVGVTVLTSLGEKDLVDIGCSYSPQELVVKRAKLAHSAGLDGVVTSPREARGIVDACSEGFVRVCPGIRPSWSVSGDQKRIMTPSEALSEGASYLVVGRPITKAEDPREAAMKILYEMEGVNNVNR